MKDKQPYLINEEQIPKNYPTHMHSSEFWEKLGRVVATCGFLEEVLMKAIFSLTSTVTYNESELHQQYNKWINLLERALSDPLGELITKYENAVKKHPDASKIGLGKLIKELRKVSTTRNALCHGSWRPPDSSCTSKLFYIDRNNKKCVTNFNVDFLEEFQKGITNLACIIINSVTVLGYQFPGSDGPGEIIYKKDTR